MNNNMRLTQSVRILLPTLMLTQSAWAELLNVDFGAGTGPSQKVGFAATGTSANDYWNYYTRDNPNGSWKVNGFLANLKDAGGQTTSVGITINNGDGAWGYPSSDPMLAGYIYSLSGGILQTIVTVTNLPAGKYNFYLYGADSHFNLKVDATDYGTKTSYDNPLINPPPWLDGQQYARFSDVPVGASQSVVLTPGAGADYFQGIIGGMQIELVPEPSGCLMLGLGGWLLGRRARTAQHRLLCGAGFVTLGSAQALALNLYVAEFHANRIERFDANGHGTIFANSGLNGPMGLAFDSLGKLYVGNWSDNTILKYTPSGTPYRVRKLRPE